MPVSVDEFVLAFREFSLSDLMVRSGRSVDDGPEEGREKRRDDRREASTGEVLHQMETVTVERQEEWNRRVDEKVQELDNEIQTLNLKITPLKTAVDDARKELEGDPAPGAYRKQLLEELLRRDAPELERLSKELALLTEKRKVTAKKRKALAHAVGGHGKGTDQLGRVLHGHRSDEMRDNPAPSTRVIDGRTVGVYDEVGHDPSNTSGGFSRNEDMLETVNEAFAQASMVSTHSRQQRQTDESYDLDQDRLGLTVEGQRPLGDKIEVVGAPKQPRGRTLQGDELDERMKRVRETKGVTNATVILDPEYDPDILDDEDSTGRERERRHRTGWGLQTAYPVDDVPMEGSSYATPEQVSGQIHELEHQKDVLDKRMPTLKAEQKQAQEAYNKKYELVRRARKNQLKAKGEVLSTQSRIAQYTEEARKSRESLDGMGEAIADLQEGGKDVAEALRFSTMTDEELLRNRVALAALIKELTGLQKRCYDSTDDSDDEDEGAFGGMDLFSEEPTEPTVKADRAGDEKVYEQTLMLLTWLSNKLDPLDACAEQQARVLEETETMERESRVLELDPEWGPIQKTLESRSQTLESAQKEDFRLRKAIHLKKQAHEDQHGMPAPTLIPERYDPKKGEYPEKADRPEKPPVLKGVDGNFDPLTAHHLYPWNKIRTDLNRALEKRDKAMMQALFKFGQVTVSPDFWTELAKDPDQRNYSFNAQLNMAAQQICWSPRNVFMGPSGRSDDPGEEVDKTYEDSGIETLNSMLAGEIEKQGGLFPRLDDSEIEEDLNAREAQKEKDTKGYKAEKVTADMILEEKRKREAARLEVAKLYAKIESAEEERLRLVGLELEKLKPEEPVFSRHTRAEVRQDLLKSLDREPGEDAITLELNRRLKLLAQFNRLTDLLGHQTKAFDPSEWENLDTKPRQKHSPPKVED